MKDLLVEIVKAIVDSPEDVVIDIKGKLIELARNDYGIQAFKVNNLHYGVQFHPEFTMELMDIFIDINQKDKPIKKEISNIDIYVSNIIFSISYYKFNFICFINIF